ncbi:DNA (cytosine-5)-methyltransferase 1 [Sphingomonas kaistensis]|uniref:DNA (cytosine-5-)-methyltransferase n=1 Tax=Sphingomonas kaistensis TaxID=298708 RepID=A0A7X6BHH6_9SPHN|nr:DNA cytosine methyltransferase [Sphingomonas kaistensis]NJC06545.1 DNA (cytosine-5)-methyltransferase 1 [Sphingomonas kaistensis]
MSLIVDNFAGGGGASTGIEQALGRAVDIAINHDEQAIRMHEVNHPGTRHIRNNIWQIDPQDVTDGRPVDLAWFSPDCKHFSKAKGGKPREKSIRDLAWVVVLWAKRVRPATIFLENVEEFRTWGPLCDEGKPIKERAGETFDKWCRELRKSGYRLQFRELRACDYGAPTIRKRFFMIARCDGRPIVWPEPTHGKPGSPEVVSGKRLPWRTAAEIIDWSIPCPSIFERKKPLAEKTLRRIAHGIMKFVVNNPAPFIVPLTHHGSPDRSSPLSEPLVTVTGANRGELAIISPHVTKFRNGAIGSGADEPVPTVTANSFVKRPGGAAPLGRVDAVLAPFASYAQQGGGNRSAEEPLHTVTASDGDHNTVVGAVLTPFYGDKGGQPRASNPVDEPLRTSTTENRFGAVCAFLERQFGKSEGAAATEPLPTTTAGGGGKSAVVCAHIEQANGGPNNDQLAGRRADAPISTIATKGSQQRLVTSNLLKLRGTCAHGQPVDEPLHTVSAGGTHMAEVRAFLLKYYGTDQDPQLGEPLHSVTTKDRFGLVTVTIEGEEYVIVDIGMRMLTPRELFNAQGFPANYIIDQDAEGRPITKTAQVAKCGNSVCPPIAEALVRANVAAAVSERAAA